MTEPDLAPLHAALESFIPLGRSGLLPALHAAQKIYGWLPAEVASEVARELRVPLADVHGVIEFYSLFYNEQIGRRVFRVCTDPACALKGGDQLLNHLCRHHGVEAGQMTPDGRVTIEASPCLGLCEQAPAALVDDQAETNIDLKTDAYELGRPRSLVYGPLRVLTGNCGKGTTTLKQYGPYAGLKRALGMQPEDVVNEVKTSGLVGRGGAAFPTGVKWEGAAREKVDLKYVICNADESEPGTFKDRVLLLDDPHGVIEGMCISGYAIGATKGFIYIRGEYPYIVPVLENALTEARIAGWLGADIQGTGFAFDIEVRVGAGAYICGEETALFESIEGKRGFPRVKPPFPTTNGLFGKPTVINNVETLACVPLIVREGAAAYRKYGTEKSPGPKLFCVSGDVARPGVYEIPFGLTLRELLGLAGGVAGGRNLGAVLFGGAAGAFATSRHLDVKLTFEDLREAGLPLGSGVVMVFDESRDLRDVLKRLGHFFAHESCGKCYPCQMGTQRQMEVLNRIAAGRMMEGDLQRLQDIGWTMIDASLCGLGQTAAGAVLSAIKLWPEMFEIRPPIKSVPPKGKEIPMTPTMNSEPQGTEMPQPPETPQPWMPAPQSQPEVKKPMPEMMPAKPAKKRPARKAKPAKRKPARKTAAKKKAKAKPAKKKVTRKVKSKKTKSKARKTAARRSTRRR